MTQTVLHLPFALTSRLSNRIAYRSGWLFLRKAWQPFPAAYPGRMPVDNFMPTASLCWQSPGLTVESTYLPENDLSNLTLDSIEKALQLMNVNMAEANDIATLIAFPAMPADLDNDSRKALRRLRDKVMERAKSRADD